MASSSAYACLPLHTPPSASIITKPTTPILCGFNTSTPARKLHHHGNYSTTCKAGSSSSSSSPITDFDLYDLLGIDSSSNQSQIKMAYRSLQKKCHPDIAGPPGHDMAIVLNEAYSVLSDPNARSAYDKEQGKIADLRGYTGKALYSSWFGPESEERAVFVDEVKCVGCLKCALLAEKTFAIESVYGRARVVAQWADPESKIQEAIDACPVDCISMVERSDLAALEFLMSKQPRECVRMSTGNSGGARVSNIFVDVNKFQTKYHESTGKISTLETDPQREARMVAIQAIRSISNWLYWHSSNAGAAMNESLTHMAEKSVQPDMKKLRDAAAARKRIRESGRSTRLISENKHREEYWKPSTQTVATSIENNPTPKATSRPSPRKQWKTNTNRRKNYKRNNLQLGIPVVVAMVASVVVRFQVGEGTAGGVNEHIAGSSALEVVNSSWSQVFLAGVTWYFIGMLMVELVGNILNRSEQ